MGSKSAAKTLMAACGVPLVPGYDGADQTTNALREAARQIGLPLLIKASAGGGGRGMRIVRDMADFDAALVSAQREALSAFGDASMLLERYIERPRHIEVQVFGDLHGNLVHLFERDCSLQRRHQKVIEEAPAIALSDSQRGILFSSALKAASAVNYVGAGTVEFILDQAGAVYFIEMNTRLQVEHPVTEAITGVDLVEWQLRIASGEVLPLKQEAINRTGHAIEVRVYAEDPAHDFRPSTGRIDYLTFPEMTPNTRVDTGFAAHDSVTPYYDAMLAKVICHEPTRIGALKRMQEALGATQIVGITTNIDYLQRIVGHPAYVAGGFDTHFVEAHQPELVVESPSVAPLVLVSAALAVYDKLQSRSTTLNLTDRSPWAELIGFRVNAPAIVTCHFVHGGQTIELNVRPGPSGLRVELPTGTITVQAFEKLDDTRYRLVLDDQSLPVRVIDTTTDIHVFLADEHHRLRKVEHAHGTEDAATPTGNLAAPMPGAIRAVLVKVGDTVQRGAPLIVLEAMKIEHTICAPVSGVITAIRFNTGDQVTTEGAELISLEPDSVDQSNKPNAE